MEDGNNKSPKQMLELFGKLLLEIRKSLGNKKTKLTKLELLKFTINDIDKILT